MTDVQQLIFLFSGLVAINATLAGVLWARQRTPLYRALFLVWAFSMASGLIQAAVPSERWMVYAFGFPNLVVNLMMVDLFRRALDLVPAWRAYAWAFGVGLLGTVAGSLLGSPFWATALPIAVGGTFPLLHLIGQAIRRPRGALTTTGWAAVVSVALYALHLLDYPFLRNDPRFATLGFAIAILVIFAISVTAPAVILERTASAHARMQAEVERLNEQLMLRIDEALASVRSRDEFLSIASHELRSPITTLRLQVHLARGGAGPMPLAERLGLIDRQTVRLEALINQLLDVSRITSQRFELAPGDADLAELVDEIARRMEPQLHQVDSTLNVARGPAVRGRWDVARLEQVLVNLLSNALKFGAGKPIDVRLEDLGHAARLTVSDRGVGIPLQEQARIFLPFERASSSDKYDGLGLGLWITAQIVEAHGGNISVTSAPGEGAAFIVVLPKEPQPAAVPLPT